MPKLLDFRCNECRVEFEQLTADHWPPPMCEECGSEDLDQLFTAAKLGFMNDKQTRTEALKKRATEHTAREQRKGNLPTMKDKDPFGRNK